MTERRRSSLVELVKARLREFRREPSAFFFVLFMPILWMAILGPAFSGGKDPTHGIGLRPADESVAADDFTDRLRAALRQAPGVRLSEGGAAELDTRLKRGDVQVVVEVTGPETVRYLYDPASREAREARWRANDVVQKAAGRAEVLAVEDRIIRVPGMRYIDFLVPGLLGVSILSTSLFGVGMTIVSNRRENLLKRFLATPMRPSEYILSHIIGRGAILAVEVGTQLAAAALLFDFQVAGRLLDFLLLAALGAAALTAMGILFGARTANTAAMNGFTNLVSLPMMLLSGAWFSRSHFPDWLAEASRFLPLSPLVDGLRRVALEGAGLQDLSFEMGLLGLYFVVFSAVAALLFKWY